MAISMLPTSCPSSWQCCCAEEMGCSVVQRYFMKGEMNHSSDSLPSAFWVPTLFSETSGLQVPCEYLAIVLSLWLRAQWEISHFQRGLSHGSYQALLSLKVPWALQAAPDAFPEGHHLWLRCRNSPGYVMR